MRIVRQTPEQLKIRQELPWQELVFTGILSGGLGSAILVELAAGDRSWVFGLIAIWGAASYLSLRRNLHWQTLTLNKTTNQATLKHQSFLTQKLTEIPLADIVSVDVRTQVAKQANPDEDFYWRYQYTIEMRLRSGDRVIIAQYTDLDYNEHRQPQTQMHKNLRATVDQMRAFLSLDAPN